MVLAAHYDSKYFRSTKFIGATDSAAPCALLTELAHSLDPLLGQPKNQDVTLQIIFFDGEEAFVNWTPTDSIYGSRHLAQRWDNDKILGGVELFVLLDLLGYPQPVILNYIEKTSPMYERLKRIEDRLRKQNLLNTKDLPSNFFPTSKRLPNMPAIEDDHVPFLNRGVPVLHIIPYQFPDVWHTSSDDATAIDLATLDDFGRIFKVFVSEYLDLDVQPV